MTSKYKQSGSVWLGEAPLDGKEYGSLTSLGGEELGEGVRIRLILGSEGGGESLLSMSTQSLLKSKISPGKIVGRKLKF